jgi:release factor glutamine methyltransferase
VAEALREAGIEEPKIEAQVLLQHVLGQSRAWIYQHPDSEMGATALGELNRLVEARRAGEPLAYLVGAREFFGRPFFVDPRVLVPRPETEELLERAMAYARGMRPECHRNVRIVDVGAGSGILAVSLAVEIPEAIVYGIDRSIDALAVARQNVARHGVAARVRLIQSDLLEGLTGRFDLIVANLPYVPSAEVESAAPEVRREPRLALDGGPDGLGQIRRLLHQAPAHLSPSGGLFMEIGWNQGAEVVRLAREAFPNRVVTLHPDLAGRDRVVAVTPSERYA